MSPPPNRRRKSRRPGPIGRLVREFVSTPLLLEQESACLIVLSALDLFMTYLLLRQGMQFYEANPVARWWFARWNIAGMTAFKFLMVGVAVVACEVVERRRPNLGRAVMWLGVVAAAFVFLHGLRLFLAPGAAPGD